MTTPPGPPGATPATEGRRQLHVASTGDDNGTGAADRPWRTIQRAAAAVRPGDTVIVHPGRYRGFTLEEQQATAAAPITFRGEAGAVIDAPGPSPKRPPVNTALGANEWPSWPFGITILYSSHVVVEGFEVRDMPGPETAAGGLLLHKGGGGVRLGVCRNVTVRGNQIHNSGRWGLFSEFCDDVTVDDNLVSKSALEHGVYLSSSGDRPVVRRNRLWGNARAGVILNGDNNFGNAEYRMFAVDDGVISGAIIEDNDVRDNGARGSAAINLDGVSDSIIRNNVLEENHGDGIALLQWDGATGSQRNQIVGNRVTMATDGGWAIGLAGCDATEIKGDLCASANVPLTGPRPPARASGSTGNVVRGNLLVARSAAGGSIRVDSASLAPDAKSGARLVSDANTVVDRFSIDDRPLSLAEWRARTGQDPTSTVRASP